MLLQPVAGVNQRGDRNDDAVFLDLDFNVPFVADVTVTTQKKDQKRATRERSGDVPAHQEKTRCRSTRAKHGRRSLQYASGPTFTRGYRGAEHQNR